MHPGIRKLAKLYKKIESGKATEEEKEFFEQRLIMSSFTREGCIWLIKEYIRDHKLLF